MSIYTTLGETIEQEYLAYCADHNRNLNQLFEAIRKYIRPTISMIVRKGDYLDENSVDEIEQDVLVSIFEKGIDEFEKESALFATYCTAIAKNKAIDWGRKWMRRRETFYESDEYKSQEVEEKLSSAQYHLSPEQQYLMSEQLKEQYELMKKYLYYLVNQKEKPYRTVGCCYTLILFGLQNPNTIELSSPKWAFTEMKKYSIDDNANIFINRFHYYMPYVSLRWGNDFLDGMDEKEDGIYISDMIFGEHFVVKDLENWSLRFRKKIRQQLVEEVFEL